MIVAQTAPQCVSGGSLTLPFGLFIVAIAATCYAAWRYRDWIGSAVRKSRLFGFIIIVIGFLATGAAGVFSEGANPKGLLSGAATIDELEIYWLLVGLAYIGFLAAAITWAETTTSADEIESLNLQLADAKLREQNAEREAEFSNAINRLFLAVVGKKTDRFLSCSDELRDMPTGAPHFVKRIHSAHLPFQQCIDLLAAAWSVCHLHLTEQNHRSIELRLALFAIKDDYLAVELSTNGKRTGVVQGAERHSCRDHYCVGSLRGNSLAVQTAFSQEILIEPDTTRTVGELKTHYRHYDDSHHRRIHSIVGIPLGLPNKPGQPCRMVVCVDTNIVDGFTADHMARLEQIRDNLEQRLLIEMIQTAAFREPAGKKQALSKVAGNASKPNVS